MPSIQPADLQLRAACHQSGPRAPSSDPRATHIARHIPFFQERTPNLTAWGITPAQTPNSMGTNTWAEKLQALLLSNCTLRYLVLMAVAHMICYQHFISKTSMANAVRSKSGPCALSVGPRRSLCQGPRLSVRARVSVSGPGALSSGPGALCRGLCPGPAVLFFTLCVSGPVSVSGPSALCVGPRCSLCWGSALSVSGPDGAPLCSLAVCVGPSGSSDPRAHLHVIHRVRGPSTQIRVSPIRSAGPQLRSVRWSCGPQPACHFSDPPATFQAPRAPIPNPQLPLPPSSDPRATHPVLLAYQPDVFHHVILKQCFALIIANTCSHSLGILTQILDNSIKERLYQLLFLRVYLRLQPLYFFGQGFCAICRLGPQKQTMLSQVIRGLDLLQPSDKPTLPCATCSSPEVSR